MTDFLTPHSLKYQREALGKRYEIGRITRHSSLRLARARGVTDVVLTSRRNQMCILMVQGDQKLKQLRDKPAAETLREHFEIQCMFCKCVQTSGNAGG